MPTSTSSIITAGSYWRNKRNESLVKVIVPYAENWVYRCEDAVVSFRSHSNRYGEAMEIRRYYATTDEFLADFEPAEWDGKNLIWKR